jgi:hypothetical protein
VNRVRSSFRRLASIAIVALCWLLLDCPRAQSQAGPLYPGEPEFSDAEVKIGALGFLQLVFGDCEPSTEEYYLLAGPEAPEDDDLRALAGPKGYHPPPARPSVSLFYLLVRSNLRVDLRTLRVVRIQEPKEGAFLFEATVIASKPSHEFVLGLAANARLLDVSTVWFVSIDRENIDRWYKDRATQFVKKHKIDIDRPPRCANQLRGPGTD